MPQIYEQTINQSPSPASAASSSGFFTQSQGSYDKVKAKSSGSTPAQTSGSSTAGGETFIYPSAQPLGQYFVKFVFQDFYQEELFTPRNILEKATIILPIPNNLQESHSMGYSEKSLGLLGLLEKNLLNAGSINSTIKNITGGPGSGSEEGLREFGKKLGLDLGAPQTLMYLGRSFIGGISDTAGAVADRITGTALNPFQALQFTGVNLREHSFTYRFSPNNAQESALLKKIIKTFKVRMHPDAPKTGGGSIPLFNFPDSCEITFGPALDSLYYIKRCYLKNMTVNYAPQGTPSFFAGTNEPVEIEMSLQFGEVAPILREDILEQYKSVQTGQSEPASAVSAPVSSSAPAAGDLQSLN